MKLLLTLTVTLAASACATRPISPANRIELARSVPYALPSTAPAAVRAECALPEQLPKLIKEEAGRLVRVMKGTPRGRRVLSMTITKVFAPAGGVWSGSKHVEVEGRLLEDGKEVGSFRAANSTGVFGRGWSGTCDLLEVIAEKLADDIAEWLERPVPGAKLGEA